MFSLVCGAEVRVQRSYRSHHGPGQSLRRWHVRQRLFRALRACQTNAMLPGQQGAALDAHSSHTCLRQSGEPWLLGQLGFRRVQQGWCLEMRQGLFSLLRRGPHLEVSLLAFRALEEAGTISKIHVKIQN